MRPKRAAFSRAAGARPARATGGLGQHPDRQVLIIRVYTERICAARNVPADSRAHEHGRVPDCVP